MLLLSRLDVQRDVTWEECRIKHEQTIRFYDACAVVHMGGPDELRFNSTKGPNDFPRAQGNSMHCIVRDPLHSNGEALSQRGSYVPIIMCFLSTMLLSV